MNVFLAWKERHLRKIHQTFGGEKHQDTDHFTFWWRWLAESFFKCQLYTLHFTYMYYFTVDTFHVQLNNIFARAISSRYLYFIYLNFWKKRNNYLLHVLWDFAICRWNCTAAKPLSKSLFWSFYTFSSLLSKAACRATTRPSD